MPTLNQSLTTAWTLSSTCFILLMSVGYTLIESAQVRKKNRQFVVIKNMLIFVITLMCFFVVGYALAFGGTSVGIVGAQSEYIGVYSANGLYHERQFPFYFATSLIVGILVTGSMGERTRLEPMLGFILLLQIILFPVILNWTWDLEGGFLRDLGYFDRGGSVVIFYTGALAGVIGAIVLGPRYGKYMTKEDQTKIDAGGRDTIKKPLAALLEDALEDTVEVDDLFLRKVRKLIKQDAEDNDFYNINVPMMVIGTFIVVIGWSMLNACGYGPHSLNSVESRYAAELAFLNTFLAGSFTAFISFLLKRHIVRGDHQKTPRYDIRSLCNGYLAGIAAVTAGSGVMKPWGALITGIVEAIVYMTVCLIMKKCKFDDPMENFQIYGSASFWAMVSSVFFIPDKGILWGDKNSGSLLGIQLLGWAAISVFTTIITWIYFFSFKRCRLLKLRKAEEVIGHDTLNMARSKGIDINSLIEVISKAYPNSRRKGC